MNKFLSRGAITKFSLTFGVVVTCGGAQTLWAEQQLNYTCKTKVEYKTYDDVGIASTHVIPMEVSGWRTAAGALGDASVTTDECDYQDYASIDGYVSNDIVQSSAYSNKNTGFEIVYMGKGSTQNWAKVVMEIGGALVTATNHSDSLNKDFDVVCDIEQAQ